MRSFVRLPAFRLLPLLAILALAACGASAREKTLHTTLLGVNAARDGFVAYDEAAQRTIVDHAETYEAGREALDGYRASRKQVIDAFIAAYRAIAIAALVNDDPKSLATVLGAARRLGELLDGLGCSACGTVVP